MSNIPCAAGPGYVHFNPENAAQCVFCRPKPLPPPMNTTHYEIVGFHTKEVIGCTCATDGDLTALEHASSEDSVEFFGEITEKQYNKYGDRPHRRPVSPPDRRFRIKLEPVLVPYVKPR